MSKHGLDCQQCDHLAKRKAQRIANERGLSERGLVDPGPTRRHIRHLLDQGNDISAIANVAGIHKSTLFKFLADDERAAVLRSTERKILAVTTPLQHSQGTTASRLRLQALLALGYEHDWISRQIGARSTWRLRSDRKIRFDRAAALLDLCRRIGDTPGPSRQGALLARSRGWRVPADYDDDLFYSPYWDGTEPPMEDTGSRAQMCAWVEEYDFLLSFGMSHEAAIARLGLTPTYMRVLLWRRARGMAPFGRPSESASEVKSA